MSSRKPLRSMADGSAAWWLVPLLLVAAVLSATFLSSLLAELPPAERALAQAPAKP